MANSFQSRFEMIDHLPILSLLTNNGLDFASALQEYRQTQVHTLYYDYNTHYFSNTDWGTGFTLNKGTADGFLATNKLTNLGDELNKASNKVIATNKQEDDKISTSYHRNLSRFRANIDISSDGPIKDDFEDESLKLSNDISYLLQGYDDIGFQIDVQGQRTQKFFQSTSLNEISITVNHMLLNIEVFVRNNSQIRLRETIGGINQTDISWDEIEQKVNAMLYRIKNLKQRKYPKSGNYRVVLSPDAAYSLVHETLGHACEADQVINNSSFLSGLKGYKVASSELTLIDDPHIRALGWAEYDDEGLKTQGTIIVDEGILNNYLHNQKTAALMGEMSTGNARSSSYLTSPEPRQTNLFLEPKDFSQQELVEEVKDGLYIGPTESATTSIYTGDFAIESQYCYLIENGEMTDLMGSVTLLGQALEILNQISAIGKEPELIPAICLKNDSKLFVGGISPEISVSSIRVS